MHQTGSQLCDHFVGKVSTIQLGTLNLPSLLGRQLGAWVTEVNGRRRDDMCSLPPVSLSSSATRLESTLATDSRLIEQRRSPLCCAARDPSRHWGLLFFYMLCYSCFYILNGLF